jgi:hypothetical protein
LKSKRRKKGRGKKKGRRVEASFFDLKDINKNNAIKK